MAEMWDTELEEDVVVLFSSTRREFCVLLGGYIDSSH
jgi:hypothetical protein